jgi:hypothetical protein
MGAKKDKTFEIPEAHQKEDQLTRDTVCESGEQEPADHSIRRRTPKTKRLVTPTPDSRTND